MRALDNVQNVTINSHTAAEDQDYTFKGKVDISGSLLGLLHVVGHVSKVGLDDAVIIGQNLSGSALPSTAHCSAA